MRESNLGALFYTLFLGRGKGILADLIILHWNIFLLGCQQLSMAAGVPVYYFDYWGSMTFKWLLLRTRASRQLLDSLLVQASLLNFLLICSMRSSAVDSLSTFFIMGSSTTLPLLWCPSPQQETILALPFFPHFKPPSMDAYSFPIKLASFCFITLLELYTFLARAIENELCEFFLFVLGWCEFFLCMDVKVWVFCDFIIFPFSQLNQYQLFHQITTKTSIISG